MERYFISLPHVVYVVAELQVPPLKQVLLFVHGFCHQICEIVGCVYTAVHHGSGAHDARDGAHHAAIQANWDCAAFLFCLPRKLRQQLFGQLDEVEIVLLADFCPDLPFRGCAHSSSSADYDIKILPFFSRTANAAAGALNDISR